MAAGYLTDVYRGNRLAERSFLVFALFSLLLPFHSLSRAPSAGADTLLPQSREPHRSFDDGFRSGLAALLWGAFKKLVIADRLGHVGHHRICRAGLSSAASRSSQAAAALSHSNLLATSPLTRIWPWAAPSRCCWASG
ncbi:MAG: hypothetical protein ACLSAF_19885 [Intestinimonas sp.]